MEQERKVTRKPASPFQNFHPQHHPQVYEKAITLHTSVPVVCGTALGLQTESPVMSVEETAVFTWDPAPAPENRDQPCRPSQLPGASALVLPPSPVSPGEHPGWGVKWERSDPFQLTISSKEQARERISHRHWISQTACWKDRSLCEQVPAFPWTITQPLSIAAKPKWGVMQREDRSQGVTESGKACLLGINLFPFSFPFNELP